MLFDETVNTLSFGRQPKDITSLLESDNDSKIKILTMRISRGKNIQLMYKQ